MDQVLAEQDPSCFLIEGFVHSATTVLVGEAFAGKSRLALEVALAVTGLDPTVALPVRCEPRRVAVIPTDPEGITEWAGRLKNRQRDPGDRILLIDPPPTADNAASFAQRLTRHDVKLCIVDNFTTLALDADVVKTNEVGGVLARLDPLHRAGIAVLLLCHKGKSSKSPGAAGAYVTAAWARHELELSPAGKLTARTNGPPVGPWQLQYDKNGRLSSALRREARPKELKDGSIPPARRRRSSDASGRQHDPQGKAARVEQATDILRREGPTFQSVREAGRVLEREMGLSENVGRTVATAVIDRGSGVTVGGAKAAESAGASSTDIPGTPNPLSIRPTTWEL